jgi:hypothetical protein
MRERDMILTARITQQNDPLLSYRCVRRSEIRKRAWYHGSSTPYVASPLFHPLLHNHKHSLSILVYCSLLLPFFLSYSASKTSGLGYQYYEQETDKTNKQTNTTGIKQTETVFHPLHKKNSYSKNINVKHGVNS